MRLFRVWAPAAAALILAACASTSPPPAPAPRPAPPGPTPSQPEPPRRTLELGELPGWVEENHSAAFSAFRATCHVSKDAGLADACRRARAMGAYNRDTARAFLEQNFRAEVVGGDGLLTGYFAPEYQARLSRQDEFTAPLMGKPDDLVAGRPYLDRAAIEARKPDKVLAWMRPEELFFLQVQGSGVLTMEDGRRLRAAYAAHNSHAFVGIANVLRERGVLPDNNTSAESIRQWLANNRGLAADEVMRLNPRYVFFRLEPDDGRDPVGAAGVPLPPGRAIAVDPASHAYGGLYWIDADAPKLAMAFPAYRRAVMALDTGGAIRGGVRADLYLGKGDAAGLEAGRIRHNLSLYRIVPR